MQSTNRLRRQQSVGGVAIASAALVAVTAMTARAGVSNAGGGPLADSQEFQISTAGATALGALNRGAATNGQNFPTGENNSLWRLGTGSLLIGRTTYTSNPGASQLLGLQDKTLTTGNPFIDDVKTADRLVYQYHEVGSINGILATVKGGGLFLGGGNPFGNELPPDVPSQSAPRWRMGWSQINSTQYIINGSGSLSTNPGGYPAYIPPNVRIGWSDVRSFQAFAADDLVGTASPNRKPRDLTGTVGTFENAQYGIGRNAFNAATGDNGTNFQALANRTVIAGEAGGDPSTSFLRNETVAIVPFALAANPGTGLAKITEDDGRWLQGTGRLKNGANFNSVTREIGSGTRNQGDNNFEIDASWGGGERDRRSLASGSLTQYTDTNSVLQTIRDVNGNAVTVRPGDEMPPNLDLFGIDAGLSAAQTPKEHRNGPLMHFSDKNSGGSGVRPTVINNRMALGILSVGDVGDRGLQNLDGTVPANSRNTPMRILKIDWVEQAGEDDNAGDDGFVQPTAFNVTNGRYQMWSAAQAVTVIGVDTNADGKPDTRGTIAQEAANPNLLIWGDVDDQTQNPDGSLRTTPLGPVGVGVHRKFLNNERQSVSNFPSASITPADGVIAAGFVPEQVMKVSKDFDGGTQTWNNNPAGFNSSLYDLLVTNNPPGGSQNLKSRLNWIDPSSDPINAGGTLGFIGDLASASNSYTIFAQDVSNTSTTPTKAIRITGRNALAGDMDGNGVRDMLDVPALANAYAASESQGSIAGNGTIANMSGTLSSDDLIVLTDFNGSGNIDPTSTNASPVYRAVDRRDVIYFLKGATVDTVNPNPATGYAGSANIQTRREDGVRLGKLKKNGAIDTFNGTLNGLVGTAKPFGGGNWSQVEIDALKVQKGDVDGDGLVTRKDAKFVDSVVGVAPYSLTLEQIVVNYNVDPIYAELTDDDVIDHVDPDGPAEGALVSDFQVIRAELGTAKLLDGDADFNGIVDVGDLGTLATNWQTIVDRWSAADFDFNGTVDVNDLGLLSTNWQQSVAGVSFGDALAAVGLPASAVPEPTGIALLSLGAMLGLRRRR